MLHVFFALNCIACGRKQFKVNKLVNVIALRMTFHKAIAMLVDATNEVIGHPDVDCAAWSARKDVR